ncbi:hypothetical protein CNMCM6936_008178 [Aspergillus lentulus]|uniref:Uncharacterized protein n=1 Tax=Aspergillus lentulus TaxID=293939 RepID=A0AAN5YTL5_ASPLE|nr:hypothetical protein CNMCM6069_003155 [Aspergillus lentulus]KAF4165188.1 hypothetical protein CNMCM6936_008178 [Aspergillus lentulus]KAF4177233.1 hypothetical protein CNMCM8060_005628 [Aspergillus lentulus]KAF4187987.1 hypothetical protein CNMCM7927_002864 [Aspergillus lentulus]KAF4197374.1 hypothetical protein CNMCM8694_003005 [Aspergillus lentulus]
MDQIKKEIEADPYEALFGRRLDPFKSWGKHENIFSSLFQSLFGHGSKAEAEPKVTDTTARMKTDAAHSSDPRPSGKQSASPSSEVNAYKEPAKDDFGNYEFDPITGRMVPKKGETRERSQDTPYTGTPDSSIHPNTVQSEGAQSAGFLSPVDRSEAHPDDKGVTGAAAHENTVQSEIVDDPSPQSTTLGPGQFAYGDSLLPAKPGNSDENILKEPTEPRNTTTAFTKGVPASEIETANEPLSIGNTRLEADNLPPSAINHQNEGSSGVPTETKDPLATPHRTSHELKQQEEWVTQAEKAEDLDILRASDIRTPYELKKEDGDPEEQLKDKRRKLDLAFEMADDLVKDIDAQRIREKYKILEASKSKETVLEPLDSPKAQLHSQSSMTASTSLPRPQEDFHNVRIGPNHESERAHDQPKVSPNCPWATATYRVLVYDPSTLQVVEAETSSSLQSTDKLLSLAEVLSRLSHPAKFVPYLAKMHDDGYEIISGGEDILIFRKVSESGSVMLSNTPSHGGSAGRLTSPQSDSDENIRAATAPSDSSSNPAIVSTDHAKARPRVRTALRRMLISGVATAGTCYAIGVVVEYFRTGGQDGLGIDGFTEFESERRRRDRE